MSLQILIQYQDSNLRWRSLQHSHSMTIEPPDQRQHLGIATSSHCEIGSIAAVNMVFLSSCKVDGTSNLVQARKFGCFGILYTRVLTRSHMKRSHPNSLPSSSSCKHRSKISSYVAIWDRAPVLDR